MAIWTIADLHLSFGVPNKHMSVFGPHWEGYTDKIEKNWRSSINPEDLILIPGDISWAINLEEAKPDLEWIDELPGTKVFIKGNHDYWWHSLSKVKKALPPSCHVIQNDCFNWNEVTIAGARLWDTPDLNFNDIIDFKDDAIAKKLTERDTTQESRKIYQREIGRLEASLKSMNATAKLRIAMTHYPPIGPSFEETEASRLLEKYQVNICVFGHLHNVKPNREIFGSYHGIQYHLTACDYLKNFNPLLIY